MLDIFLAVIITINVILIGYCIFNIRSFGYTIEQLVGANNAIGQFIRELTDEKEEVNEELRKAESNKLNAEANFLNAQSEELTKELSKTRMGFQDKE